MSWYLAVLILGLNRPTFAPIAEVISLGLAVGERARRAVELTLGVAFGVAIADLLVSVVGVGAVQAGAVAVLAMALAVFLGGEDLGAKKAAISAMIIMITFHSSQAGFPIERFLEALVGGGTALLVNALLPVNPERMVTEAADPVFGESAAVLEEVAYALESGDAERAQNAYLKAREIDARVSGLKEALVAGRETARLSPPRRRSLGRLELYAAASDQIDLIVRDVRALARAARTLSVVQPGDPALDPLPTTIRGLARATEPLPPTWRRLEIPLTRTGWPSKPPERPVRCSQSARIWRGVYPPTRSSIRSTRRSSTSSAAPAWIGRRPCKPWRRPREAPPGRTRTGLSRGCPAPETPIRYRP